MNKIYKTVINICIIVLNIICIFIGNLCNSSCGSWIVCAISTMLFVVSVIGNEKLNKMVERHEQTLTIGGDDVE